VVLPAVALVLVTLVVAVLAVDGQGRLHVAAASAARALGRDDHGTAEAALAQLAPGTASRVRRADGLVCVDVERAAPVPFAAVRLRGTSCAAERGG